TTIITTTITTGNGAG
ncbi:thr operon leader peptide, partial [Enterobacter hormaechei]|nr:thr operon leader peptide [Pseudomonas aeruginosa]